MAHVLGASGGGIRRHVAFLAAHPPPGYETAGVWGPGDLASYFDGSRFHPRRRPWEPPPAADVVHLHGLTAGTLALRPHRAPIVLTVHTDIRTQGRTATSRTLRALARVVAARADAVIAVSERVARSFPRARVIAPVSGRLGPPVRPREAVRRSLGTDAERTVVVAVARLHRDKGLGAFVRAVGALGPVAEGWICGEGPERPRLEALAASTNVRLLGHRDDVTDILGAADVFALAPVGEAYGIAVLEALRAGLPVITTDTGAARELVGDAGEVVAVGDEPGFAAALSRVVRDAAHRQALSERARARSFPPPEALVAAVGTVYEEVSR